MQLCFLNPMCMFTQADPSAGGCVCNLPLKSTERRLNDPQGIGLLSKEPHCCLKTRDKLL